MDKQIRKTANSNRTAGARVGRKAAARSVILGLAMALGSPAAAALADNNMQEVKYEGKTCEFTKAEMIGMVAWIFPPAGGVYTAVSCRKEVLKGKANKR